MLSNLLIGCTSVLGDLNLAFSKLVDLISELFLADSKLRKLLVYFLFACSKLSKLISNLLLDHGKVIGNLLL